MARTRLALVAAMAAAAISPAFAGEATGPETVVPSILALLGNNADEATRVQLETIVGLVRSGAPDGDVRFRLETLLGSLGTPQEVTRWMALVDPTLALLRPSPTSVPAVPETAPAGGSKPATP